MFWLRSSGSGSSYILKLLRMRNIELEYEVRKYPGRKIVNCFHPVAKKTAWMFITSPVQHEKVLLLTLKVHSGTTITSPLYREVCDIQERKFAAVEETLTLIQGVITVKKTAMLGNFMGGNAK